MSTNDVQGDRMENPAVSVLIASYNYESYLGATIQSVLDQNWQDFEIIVVDDGSTDQSVTLADAYAARDARIRVLRHAEGINRGLPATLRVGIQAARGEYVAFLESDDLWQPDCLERRFAALRRADPTQTGVVFNAIVALPMPGADTGWFQSYVPRVMREHATRRNTSSFSLRTALLFENKIPTFSCSMVLRALLFDCNLNAPVPRWLDWWIWIQLAQKTRFCFVPEALTLWRLHEASYNHKIPSEYLAKGNFFWKEVRRLRLGKDLGKAAWGDYLLLLPFCTVPLLRLFLIAKECGLKTAIERVRQRL